MLELLIIIVIVIVLYLLYKIWKKYIRQMEKKMEKLIDAGDWQSISSILRKRLIIDGIITGVVILAALSSLNLGLLLLAAALIWSFVKLTQSYRYSRRRNKETRQREMENQQGIEQQITLLETILNGCNVTKINANVSPQTLTQMWKESHERGVQEGFCPVVLLVDNSFIHRLNEVVMDQDRFTQWQQQMLISPVADGESLLKERFEKEKKDYEGDSDWLTDIIGIAEPCDPANDFSFYDGLFDGIILLAEIPVSEPWQIFAYIPYGGWNECPSAEEHMAIAKYWFEKYGAVVAIIAPDIIAYNVRQPVSNDSMKLAEEQFAYSIDVLQNYGNLSTLAEVNKHSTVWINWWD